MFFTGNCADEIAEMSQCGESSVLEFFKMFVTNFSSVFKEDFVQIHSGERLKLAMDVYTKLGFPGAFGSMDATHV